MIGVLERVDHLAEMIPHSFKTSQFANDSNWRAHYNSTGPEIWEQTQGKVDMVVFGIGTSGTVTGTGRFLKEKKEDIGVYGIEPYESSVLNGLPKGPHKIQGRGKSVFLLGKADIVEHPLSLNDRKTASWYSFLKQFKPNHSILLRIAFSHIFILFQLIYKPVKKLLNMVIPYSRTEILSITITALPHEKNLKFNCKQYFPVTGFGLLLFFRRELHKTWN